MQSGKDRNGDGVRCEEGDEAKHSVNTALHLRSFNYLQFLNTLRYHHFYNQHKNGFPTGIKDEADIICISSLFGPLHLKRIFQRLLRVNSII